MQEADARRALTVQFAAVAPPEDILRVHIGLTVPGMTAAQHGFPEAAGHFLSGDIAPALIDVALVGDLIPNHGLIVLCKILVRIFHMAVQILPLHTAVCDPRPVEIIKRHAVVHGAQMVVRILFAEQLGVMLPVLQGFGAHQIVFVRETPPHIAVGGKARDHIIPVQIIRGAVHLREAPAIIRMHHDDIGFDVPLQELFDAAFDPTKSPHDS